MMTYEEFKSSADAIEVNNGKLYVCVGETLTYDIITIDIRDTDLRDEYEKVREALQNAKDEYSEEWEDYLKKSYEFEKVVNEMEDSWRLLYEEYCKGAEK